MLLRSVLHKGAPIRLVAGRRRVHKEGTPTVDHRRSYQFIAQPNMYALGSTDDDGLGFWVSLASSIESTRAHPHAEAAVDAASSIDD